ncbi:hypothetical protein L7F22_062578 [Adiantum nelumboides]|nr:hypothetical protein [Adiantum nelumboides]MCO5608369.1 hypothetical protein [Adiantum nelumboides]
MKPLLYRLCFVLDLIKYRALFLSAEKGFTEKLVLPLLLYSMKGSGNGSRKFPRALSPSVRLMWKNNWSSVADENARVENSDSKVAPCIAKRQRRSSVRLDELGDEHNSSLPLHDVSSPANLQEKFQSIDFKSPCRPRVHAKSDGGLLKGSSPVVEKVSCNLPDTLETDTLLKKVTNADKMQQHLTSKSGRAGRIPRVSKLANSVKKFVPVPHTGMLVRTHHKPRVQCMQAGKGMRSGKENNADTSVDLIASAYHNTSSTSDESGQGGVMSVRAQGNNDYLPAQAQAMLGRTNQRVQVSSRTQTFEVMDEAGELRLAETNGSVRGPRGKLVITKKGRFQGAQNGLFREANALGNSMEHCDGRILDAENCSQPPVGVREWLQSLGLGKYTELFEAHEVELEVLPLLTFEDLREMGVVAVGSRRKLFFSIQQLKRAILPAVN